MNALKIRNIFIGFIVAFILFLIIRANKNHYPVDVSGITTSYPSIVIDQTYYYSSTGERLNSNLNRHEILQKKVKGYRESTYWGLEHPTQEKTRDLSNDEFKRFISEEVEINDENVYWGAEY